MTYHTHGIYLEGIPLSYPLKYGGRNGDKREDENIHEIFL